ncbi:MarR family winged helix-turn-helix transcriptional regulator [Actinopolyspora saharensis]|uniref:DNA-binding transcriptional regulator, MarR family n=1 Tax=Actinopolyspora saharensis TaxID=995062 RepID=A0A1H0YIV2_9ACTN|nr:MarR family transcriptional regulator [Actinopolyspora saharensis]SDQ15013.1 DNA-binding transcriptional regulator, MarR family [Actinopolyspora saharensis]
MSDNVDLVLRQWQSERPDLDASPMGVVGRIQRAARLLERGLRDHFATHDLQLWEFDILATLRRSGPPYRLTAGALVDTSMVTSGAITNRIDRLAAKGLVTREVDPDNRRSVFVTLSDQGRKLVDDIVDDHVRNERELLGALDQNDQDRLADLLRTLLTGLDDVPEPHSEP